jgi:hypothetical protein
MNGILYYGTPADQYVTNYGNNRLFPGNEHQITTQLPKNIALIRIVATVALTILLAVKLKATIFCWPVVVIGAAFAAWTAYSHLLSKDPLTELFYQIVGGKDQFAQLPEIRLEQNPNEKICTAISRLDWNNLDRVMYRAKTADERNVIIVKGLSRTNDGMFGAHTRSILAFIEKVGPEDVPRYISNQPELMDAILHAIFTPFVGNTFGRGGGSSNSVSTLNSGEQVADSSETRICSSITTSMANEFAAQMAAR